MKIVKRGQDVADDKLELFFSLIQEHPVIYDKSMKEHRDVDILKNVWTSIAKALDVDGMDSKSFVVWDKYSRARVIMRLEVYIFRGEDSELWLQR